MRCGGDACAYFLTVAATSVLLLIPVSPGRDHLTWLGAPEAHVAVARGPAGHGAAGLPRAWLQYYQQRPFQLFAGAAVLFALMAWSLRLKIVAVDRMRAIFREHGMHAQPVPPVSSPTDWVYRLRSSTGYRRTFYRLLSGASRTCSASRCSCCWPACCRLRTVFEVRSRAGLLPASTCSQANPVGLVRDAGTFALWPHLLCNATGMRWRRASAIASRSPCPRHARPTKRGHPSTTRRTGAWSDWTIPITTPAGFSSLDAPGGSAIQTILLTLAVPLRRELGANWLVTVAEIGTTNPLRIPLVSDTFVAGQDGPLSLWVNDLHAAVPAWDCFYRNNAGGPATVRITKAESPCHPGRATVVAAECASRRCQVVRLMTHLGGEVMVAIGTERP